MVEIERKYLVRSDAWRGKVLESEEIRQGYVPMSKGLLRIRILGGRGFITVKCSRVGISKREFEYEVPKGDADEMLDALCGGRAVSKTRHRIEFRGRKWEIDEYHDDNSGLVVAEIELSAEDEKFMKPPWLGKEVSHDDRYLNSSLFNNPYKNWTAQKTSQALPPRGEP